MLKGYMLICWNAEGVHAYLLKCWRGTCSSFGMLKGYMVKERLGTPVLDRAIRRNHKKVFKESQGWENTVLWKTFSSSVFSIRFFEKKQVFVLFSKKHKNPILNCFYCIMQHHHFQNHTIINCYSYYGILIWGVINIAHLCFRSILGQFTLKWQSLARMRTANREKPPPHKLCRFTSSLCTCPASSASI